jgi:hypothetical protein
MASAGTLHDELLDALLGLAWRQWTAAGVAGTVESRRALVDPEALLVASMTLGRYDARLFDEILDWLTHSSRLLDLSRLRRLAGRGEPIGRRLLTTSVRLAVQNGGPPGLRTFLDRESVATIAPDGVAGSDLEPVFFAESGAESGWQQPDPLFAAAGFVRSPVRLRGLSGSASAVNPVCLRFRLRALVGLGPRAEVLTYLATHGWSHGRLIAERAAYGQAPVAAYLSSLLDARLVERRDDGNKVLYRLSGPLAGAFPAGAVFVDWVTLWPALASLLNASRPDALSEDARWVRLAQVLIANEPAWRAEGFEAEVGDVRGWALVGPEVLATAVREVNEGVRAVDSL